MAKATRKKKKSIKKQGAKKLKQNDKQNDKDVEMKVQPKNKMSRKKRIRAERVAKRLSKAPPKDLRDPSERHIRERRELHVDVRALRAEREELGYSLDDRAEGREITKQCMEMEKAFKERTEKEVAAYLESLTPDQAAEKKEVDLVKRRREKTRKKSRKHHELGYKY